MKEQDAAHSFECPGCGAEINEGEFKTFGVCDACWDEGVTKKYWGPKKEHIYTDKEIIALAEAELTRLRSELQQERERVKELRDGLKIAVKYVSQGVDMFESASEAQHIKKEFQDVVNKLGLLI